MIKFIFKNWKLLKNRVLRREGISFCFNPAGFFYNQIYPTRGVKRVLILFLALFSIVYSLPFTLSPIPCLNAAGSKTSGIYEIADDITGSSGGNIYMSDGANISAQGFIGNIASSFHTAGTNLIESGFYSMLVSTPSSFYYNSISSASLSLGWQNLYNPEGTFYLTYLSTTSDLYSYLAQDSTSAYVQDFSNLIPNTSYYSYIRANYSESDYSAYLSTMNVTLSAEVSLNTFILKNVGSVSMELEFSAFENPGPGYLPSSSWTSAGNLPVSVYGQASMVYSSAVYLSGGFDGVNFSSAVYYAYFDQNFVPGGWQLTGFLPSSDYGHKMISAKGRIYIIGGYDNEGAKNEVWSTYVSSDNTLGEWVSEASLPLNSYFHAAAVYGNHIYISGGFDGSSALSSVLRGDIQDDGTISSWTPETNSLPQAVYAHDMFEFNGNLYVFGGNDGANALSPVWKAALNPDGSVGAWSLISNMPSARFAHSCEILGNRIFVIGGNNGADVQNSVLTARISSDSVISNWAYSESLTGLSQFQSSEKSGNTIVTLGGSDGSSASNEILRSQFLGTEYMTAISSDAAFSFLSESSWMSDFGWNFSSLTPNTSYYLKVKSRNRAMIESAYSQVLSTLTRAAIPLAQDWTDINISSLTANWHPNQNPSDTLYLCEVSTMPSFSPLGGSSATYLTSAIFNSLISITTYYGRVKAIDKWGRPTKFMELAPVKTLFDPALDISSPTITDNQTGDAVWRSTNDAVYDIDFADSGGSGLEEVQIKITTGPSGTGTLISDWAANLTNINSDSYTENWPINYALWSLMSEGTNYISVRAIDNVALSTSVADAFYVLKDTTAPSISVSYVPPAEWVSNYPGTVSSATFSDALSALQTIQYSASPNQLSADASAIPWTDIESVGGYLVFEATWDYNFSMLANAATNYFSLKGIDKAGNEYVLTDAFKILKNVLGPTVNISSPTALYLSTITHVSGYNFETDSETVLGTEISVMDKNTVLYWDSSDFISLSRYWTVASGTYPYILNLDLPLTEGHQYEIVARSSDASGAYSQIFATYTFTYDTQQPSAEIINPLNDSAVYSLVSINGTANDAVSGISSVEIFIKRISDGLYWNPSISTWAVSQTALAAGTTSEWTYNFSDILKVSLDDGATYYASARASDTAEPKNQTSFNVAGSTFIYYDNTPPSAPILISVSSGTLPRTIDLSWICPADDGSSGYFLSGDFLIQYSTFPEVQFSTSLANISISTSNLVAGTTLAYNIADLNANTTYYFALWAKDDTSNYSSASSTMSALTSFSSSGFIYGTVTQSSSVPVQGVIVEAYGLDNLLKASDATDSNGEYAISGLDAGNYTVKALWSANDIISWISKAQISANSSGVDFILNTDYQLASISGYIPLSFNLFSASSFSPLSASAKKPYVEIYQMGRVVAKAEIGEDGKFIIENLMPGTYSARAYNGKEFSLMTEIKLGEGQNFVFVPKLSVLNKNAVYAYPNPSRNSVNIHFETALAFFKAEVVIFNIAGRLIKKFDESSKQPDQSGWKIVWDYSNEQIASGIYIYIVKLKDISTGEKDKTIKKLAIIR